MPLKRSIHQFWPAATPGGRFDDGQGQRRHQQVSVLRHVGWVQVASSNTAPVVASAVAVARHRHFHFVGRELGDPVPPGRRKAAAGRPISVPPHGSADARGICERSVVGEEDSDRASAPVSRSYPPSHRFLADPHGAGLRECDNAVVASEQVIEHVGWTSSPLERFRSGRLGRVFVRDATVSAPKSRGGG
jgi:hypothetical protein